MEELAEYKEPSLEDYLILKECEVVFGEFPGLPPKRYFDFSIDLMSRVAPMSKNPYRMSTS
jgi:hypothetical protein